MSQDAIMFPGTIAENIAFGERNIKLDRVIEAAKEARIHDFITGQTAEAYDTQVGERGQALSGGQRQRIAIARAVYRNAPVVIFDEATSAVDNRTEVLIRDSLAEWLRERTSLIIAHRLSSIVDADVIHVIRDGHLVESGNHSELLSHPKSLYSHLWNLQIGAST